MTHKRGSVYIATTQGLVQIQSITKLTDADLGSVMSINQTSNLAGISQAYHSFVGQPQGIIQASFGGLAYRLNVSHDINQGNSWQLGAYIAHLLFNNNLLCNDNKSNNEDIIFIATGQIDTVNQCVEKIQYLSKKCISASAQIQQWQAQKRQIVFLVPKDNLRQPIKDASIQLTPISDLREVFTLCKVLGLKADSVKGVDANTHSNGHNNEFDLHNVGFTKKTSNNVNSRNPIIIEALEGQTETHHSTPNHAKQSAPKKVSTNSSMAFFSLTKHHAILFLISIAVLILLVATFKLVVSISSPKNQSERLFTEQTRFLLKANASENKADCENANVLVLSQGNLATQGIMPIIALGIFVHYTF